MDNERKLTHLFFCTILLLSCIQDDALFRESQEDWFRYTDQRMKPIVSTMQAIELRQPFMEKFCELYGIPLWDDTDIYQEADGEGIYFWIPLYKADVPGEIRNIWFFEMKDNKLNYGPISRESAIIQKYNQAGQFDYLSYKVFGKENPQRMVFQEKPTTRLYETIGYECRDAYVITVYNGVEYAEYKGTTCKEIKVWKDDMNTAIGDSDNGGGGGGSGSNVPIEGDGAASVAPKADAIFQHPAMLKENWKVLEKMIDKIMEDCMGDALYNKLKTSLKKDKINIKFKNGDSGFNYSTNELFISLDRVESNVLFHEMFHALQYYSTTVDDFNNSLLNCEIEAHYAQYLYLKKLPEYKGSKWEHEILYSKRWQAISHIEEHMSIYKPEEDFILDSFIKNTLKAVFENEKGYERYTFNENKEGLENLKLFKDVSKNCN